MSRSFTDSVTTETLAPGVELHRLVNLAKPWRAFALDIDLGACVGVRSVKGGPTAVGRRTTGQLLAGLAGQRALAAVNADFFLFAPPGIPTGAHIELGRLFSGPIARPVFALGANGAPYIGRLTVEVSVHTSRGTVRVTSWNRPTRGVPGLVDAAWGAPLDSTITRPVWQLLPVRGTGDRYVVSARSASAPRVAMGDTMFVVEMTGVGAGAAAGAATAAGASTGDLREGDTVSVDRAITPADSYNAVGGFPVLLRDSIMPPSVDSANNAAFRAENPRTALGIGANGRRLILVVIDGRQAGYSAGMTLRETSDLLRALGARDGLNLDGGGSSALVVRDPAGAGGVRVVNRPSDAAGERPVANALAVLQGCARE